MLSVPDLLTQGSHRELPPAKAQLPYLVELEFSLPPCGYMFALSTFHFMRLVSLFQKMIREVSGLVANSNSVLRALGQSPMLCLQEQQYHPAVGAVSVQMTCF